MDQLDFFSDPPAPLTPGVELVDGDLFASRCQTLVNAVNCRGAMGAGLAKQFARRFPAMNRDYKDRCARGDVRVGRPYLWKPADGAGHWVLNFPTKDDWRDPSQVEWVQQGLEHLLAHAHAWGIRSLAVPALGCGLGGLNWGQVKPLLEATLGELGLPVELYPPR